MELRFLGMGSAFNTELGNNSAYFIENKQLFLIDCGETVFQNLMKNGLLNEVNDVYLMITHTHSDHIGSVGTLASYIFYILKKKLNIILPENPKKEGYLNYIINILEAFSCGDKYNFINENEFINKYKTFNSIHFVETIHSNHLDCYGILFDTNEGYVYYSGDTNELNTVEKLIKDGEKIDKIYVDTTTNENADNSHLNINVLYKKIPAELRNKVYCMHMNGIDCIEKAKELGFNVEKISDLF